MSEAGIPPPPPLQLTPKKNSHKPDDEPKKVPLPYHIGCDWASSIEELKSACQRYGVCLYAEPPIWRYTNFDSVLQVGPMCGLVALSMLLQKAVEPCEILSIAKDLGYTNNGEMFSVKSMFKLTEHILKKFNVGNLSLECCKRKIFEEKVVQALIDGSVMLVPYDADRNHSPCLKNGHSAHWAIVTGILIAEVSEGKKQKEFRNVYVMARHGKSSNLAIWNLQDLENSNRNLNEMSQNRVNDHLEYVVPEGGLNGDNGLSGQFILVHQIDN